MHVAHFVHRYPPAVGGAEAYFARLGEYFVASGDDVTVWTTTAVELQDMWHTPCEPRSTPAFESGTNSTVRRYRPLYFPGRRYLLKALSLVPNRRWQSLTMPSSPTCPRMWTDVGRYDGPLDAVHATAFPYSFPILCGLRLARRHGVPFLLTPFLHIGDPLDPKDRTRRQYTSPALRWLLRQADRVFVQTPGEYRAVEKLGVRDERIVLQGLGVNPAECAGGDRDRARAEWGVRPDEFVIGHLANLSAEKGTVDLLKATAKLPVRVVLAGPEMPSFTRFWSTYPKPVNVTRIGVLTEAQKRDFYAGIDAFALPSRTDSFGLVLLEAWANGKPVVAYRAGGPADLIRHGEDGLLAGCGDMVELAKHLDRLATDRALCCRLGEAGRKRVAGEFRWEDKLGMVRDAMIDAMRSASRESSIDGEKDSPGYFTRNTAKSNSPVGRTI